MRLLRKVNRQKENAGYDNSRNRSGRRPIFRLTALVVCCLSWQFSTAQFIPYSQYYNSPMLTNPAEAALSDYIQLTVHYRKSRVANYEIPSISFACPFYRNGGTMRTGGAGISMISQKAGPRGLYHVTSILGTFAYTIHFTKRLHLSAGLQGGLINKKIDLSAITTDNQYTLGMYDPSMPTGENIQFSAASSAVVNSGLCWTLTDSSRTPKATIGVAVSNMNRPVYEFISSDRKPEAPLYTISGEVRLLTRRSMSVHPMFRYIIGPSSFANLGAQVRYQLAQDCDLRVGAWYKTTRALVTAIQYDSRNYFIGASMDFTLSQDMQANINNAFELSLGWRLKRKGN